MKKNYDIENLINARKEMERLMDELSGSMKKCYQKLEETKEVFDTPTAKYFREEGDSYLQKQQSYLEGDVKDLLKRMDEIIKTYEEEVKKINNFVKDSDK